MTDDVAQALREQMRVVRVGGYVSAVVCFCHTDGLPHYHGCFPLAGNGRIGELTHKLWQLFRRHVRPTILKADLTTPTQALAWQFRQAGLEDVVVNGHLAVVSPGDGRFSLEEAAEYARARHERDWERLCGLWEQHAAALIAVGFSQAEYDELLALTTERDSYLQTEPAKVREVMEVYTDPLLIVRGRKK